MNTNQTNTKATWVVVKDQQQTKICNFANNYYGDQQCYVVSNNKVKQPSK